MDIIFDSLSIKSITHEAFREMERLSMDLYDVKMILEHGFDCQTGKRKKGIIERCIYKGKKIIKVVAERMLSRNNQEYWRIRHVGVFTRRKIK
jgi:hypothetical protein